MRTTNDLSTAQRNQTLTNPSQFNSNTSKSNVINLSFSQNSVPMNLVGNERSIKFTQVLQGRSSSTIRDTGIFEAQIKGDQGKVPTVINTEFQPIFSTSDQPLSKPLLNAQIKYPEKSNLHFNGPAEVLGSSSISINPFVKQGSHPYIDELGIQPIISSRQTGPQSHKKNEFTPGNQPLKTTSQLYSAPSHTNYIAQRKNL